MPPQGRLGDKSQVPADAHGCPACAHPCIGPAIAGSPDVLTNGRPSLRVGDPGIHAACCGPNTWVATLGSATVLINGKPAHRQTDQDQHCGGVGKLIEGSGDVIVGGPPSAGGGGGAGGGGDAASQQEQQAAPNPEPPSIEKINERLDQAGLFGKDDVAREIVGELTSEQISQLPQDVQDRLRSELKSGWYSGDDRAAVSKMDAAWLGNGTVPKTPADAPESLTFSEGMNGEFGKLWGNSFPGGKSQENGGTLVMDGKGNLKLVNQSTGSSGSYTPNRNVGADEKVVGIFHTHPYDSSEGGHTGVSLSGGDLGYQMNSADKMIMAQSGNKQFVTIRTDQTPTSVTQSDINDALNNRVEDLVINDGMDFDDASREAAKEFAKDNGLAYYEGKNGILNRKYP